MHVCECVYVCGVCMCVCALYAYQCDEMGGIHGEMRQEGSAITLHGTLNVLPFLWARCSEGGERGRGKIGGKSEGRHIFRCRGREGEREREREREREKDFS